MQRHSNIGVLILLYFDPSQRHCLDAIFGSEYEMGGLRCVKYYCDLALVCVCVGVWRPADEFLFDLLSAAYLGPVRHLFHEDFLPPSDIKHT